jgi:hypothetical protein
MIFTLAFSVSRRKLMFWREREEKEEEGKKENIIINEWDDYQPIQLPSRIRCQAASKLI